MAPKARTKARTASKKKKTKKKTAAKSAKKKAAPSRGTRAVRTKSPAKRRAASPGRVRGDAGGGVPVYTAVRTGTSLEITLERKAINDQRVRIDGKGGSRTMTVSAGLQADTTSGSAADDTAASLAQNGSPLQTPVRVQHKRSKR